MSREQEVAKTIVENFWEGKLHETDNREVFVELHRVKKAKPEDLVNDFEAIIAILEKALKQLRGEE